MTVQTDANNQQKKFYQRKKPVNAWRCTMKMSNNTILITGGTSGIGYALAAQFLEQFRRDMRRMEARHDQHVRRPRQPVERVGFGERRVKSDVGGHFAVIFEIDAFMVEQLHRFDDPRRALARRMAEG